jgi:hypothetical protein
VVAVRIDSREVMRVGLLRTLLNPRDLSSSKAHAASLGVGDRVAGEAGWKFGAFEEERSLGFSNVRFSRNSVSNTK